MPPVSSAIRRVTVAASESTSPRTRTALIAVCLGFFVIQLDVTIVNVALPTIQHEIGGTVGGLQWVVDAYTLALASVMLTAGSMADRGGARRVFLIGLAGFAAGSAACAAAPDLPVLIAARAVQGLGASALLPCSLALIVHRFPDPGARARALGVWGAMGSVGRGARPGAGRRADRPGRLAVDLPGQHPGLRADRRAAAQVRAGVADRPGPAQRHPRPAARRRGAGRRHRGVHRGRPAGLAGPGTGPARGGGPRGRGVLRAHRAQAGSTDAAPGPVPCPGVQRGHRRGRAVQPVPLRGPDLRLAVPAGGTARVRAGHRAAHPADERGRRGSAPWPAAG